MFHAATQAWFDNNFDGPTDVQARGWPAIVAGDNALLVAPTGSGKTLAAFLAGIDRLGRLPEDRAPGVRVLYISPLKALVYDIERNLRAPLVGIARVAERIDEPFRAASVAIRTGDTPQNERRRQAREPAEILVTTPESLYLLLGSAAAETLRRVDTVIVDEIHALAPTKRGAHLALSLERLNELTARAPQRIGLSATVRPLDAVASFLGGKAPTIVDCSATPALDLSIRVPVPDMANPPAVQPEPAGGSILGALYSREVATPRPERGLWPSIYPKILEAIRGHRSTIVFVNSRGLCERLAHKLNELADEELVRAHHGSISHEKRADIEDALKTGALRGIVATSSLELGVDMGAVDLVLLVESPGSVARGLQRVGRAGHGVGEISRGVMYPRFKGDLLECAVIAGRMREAELESLAIPANPLDVLAQQIVAMVCSRPMTVDEVGRLVRGARPFKDLSAEALEAVLDMLSGRYPSSDFADLRPLLSWDRASDTLSPRRGAALVMRMNAGTIPDRGAFGVHLGEGGPRVGELDEEMVFETRVGDNVTLGASTWHVESIDRDRVIVSPAPGEPGRLPFWRGDGPGRPLELGRAIGAFIRRLAGYNERRARAWLTEHTPLDDLAAGNLADYISEQKAATGSVPTDRNIVVERFRDELGDWRVCILSPFGARLHAPWALALQRILSERNGYEIQVMYTDDGIVLRFADVDEPPDTELLLPDPDEVESLVTDQLAGTSLFAGLFRENAVRSLLLRRNRPGRRSPLWAQRLKAQNLLATVRQYPNFPIVIETYRQALADVFDLPGLRELLRAVRSRDIQVDDVETRAASPFSKSLVFAYVAAYLYEQDAPLAERKAQALTLDRSLLSELLGQAELRELIDPEVLEALEKDLACLSDGRRARDADELHDLLKRLGDLTAAEVAARSDGESQEWLAQLDRQRRACTVRIAGEERWIAAEDAGLYRDALGAVAVSGLPDSFLLPVERPMENLVRRYARTHGPFLTSDCAARFGIRDAQAEEALLALETSGRIERGEIRPGGVRLEWCDAEILKRLKRRNLAKLRDEAAAVDGSALASFLPGWHGIGDAARGSERLLDVVAQLQDLPLPWSLLSSTLLPLRVSGFRPDMLDALAASGQIVWVGRGASGVRDGRVCLYLRDQVRDLLDPPVAFTDDDTCDDRHRAIVQSLADGGALFLVEISERVREAGVHCDARELSAALWDLVWAGQITNDTFAPLKDLTRRGPRRGSRKGGNVVAGGRWSLVSSLSTATPDPTRQALARTRLLLHRYGVVSRHAARAENLSGGFAALYKVLRELEEQGQVRRGYFVEGLEGAQFAYAGAVDRLRTDIDEDDGAAPSADDVVSLPAIDPANPWGGVLPWPGVSNPEEKAPRRVDGAWLIQVRGRPVLYAGARGRRLTTFADAGQSELAVAIDALCRLPRGTRRGLLVVERVDGVAVSQSILLNHFLDAGFTTDYRGLVFTGDATGSAA